MSWRERRTDLSSETIPKALGCSRAGSLLLCDCIRRSSVRPCSLSRATSDGESVSSVEIGQLASASSPHRNHGRRPPLDARAPPEAHQRPLRLPRHRRDSPLAQDPSRHRRQPVRPRPLPPAPLGAQVVFLPSRGGDGEALGRRTGPCGSWARRRTGRLEEGGGRGWSSSLRRRRGGQVRTAASCMAQVGHVQRARALVGSPSPSPSSSSPAHRPRPPRAFGNS